jgi:hypothetical protein
LLGVQNKDSCWFVKLPYSWIWSISRRQFSGHQTLLKLSETLLITHHICFPKMLSVQNKDWCRFVKLPYSWIWSISRKQFSGHQNLLKLSETLLITHQIVFCNCWVSKIKIHVDSSNYHIHEYGRFQEDSFPDIKIYLNFQKLFYLPI